MEKLLISSPGAPILNAIIKTAAVPCDPGTISHELYYRQTAQTAAKRQFCILKLEEERV